MVLPPNVTMGRHYGGRWEETGRDKVMAFLWARDERVAKGHKKKHTRDRRQYAERRNTL